MGGRSGPSGLTLVNAAGMLTQRNSIVAQSGSTVKSTAFSGALGCEGIRKSVKFDLAAAPFTVELSGMKSDSIKLAISGD